jgi:hypothetical protein
MKHNFTVRLIVLAATSLFSSGVFSQLSTQSSFSASSASTDKIALASMKGVSEKMHKHFSKNFKNATDIHVRPESDHTQVRFKDNGISASVQYNKNGKWQYSIRTYDAENLSDITRDAVERSFPGYQVFGFVNEIDVLNKTATLVMIENRDSWKRVRLLDNAIDVYEEYRKAK